MTRICILCKEFKELTLFYKDKTRKDGLNPRCAPCFDRDRKITYHANKEELSKKRKVKYITNIDINRQKKRNEYNKNKDRINQLSKEKRDNEKDRFRGYKLKQSFGISLDDYNIVLLLQNNVCKICNLPNTVIDKRNNTIKNLAVDHDHKTGKVRGLLCQKCNIGLGHFDDNADFLKNAIKYLKSN